MSLSTETRTELNTLHPNERPHPSPGDDRTAQAVLSETYLRQGSSFIYEGELHTIFQVRGEVKAIAKGENRRPRVWQTRETFERETGIRLLPGRAAEMPAYEPRVWDDDRLRYAVNYTDADIYTGVSDNLKLEVIAKLNEIERLLVDAPTPEARDEYDKHKARITGTMARYAACRHNREAGKKNFTEEREARDLEDLRAYLALPPGHDHDRSVFHVDPELSAEEMRRLANSFPPADAIEAAEVRKATEHEYVEGKRLLPPKKLSQAVVFYGAALAYQKSSLARVSAEYEYLRSAGPDAISDETAEKWGERRDVALDAALRSKLHTIASTKWHVGRLAARVEELREEMKGRTEAAKESKEGAGQSSLFE